MNIIRKVITWGKIFFLKKNKQYISINSPLNMKEQIG